MSVVLDAGALIAIERGDTEMLAVVRRETFQRRPARTHAGVVGEIWRGGGGRQAILARSLQAIEIRPIDDDLGRRAGVILGQAGAHDVIDAAVVLISEDGDEIFTADASDLRDLVAASGRIVDLIEI